MTIFKDHQNLHGHVQNGHALPYRSPFRQLIRFHGQLKCPSSLQKKKEKTPPHTLKRKEISFRVSCWRLVMCLASPLLHQLPRSGILTGFPFKAVKKRSHNRSCARFTYASTPFGYFLGSTHPWPNPVPMEPYSTSVFKVHPRSITRHTAHSRHALHLKKTKNTTRAHMHSTQWRSLSFEYLLLPPRSALVTVPHNLTIMLRHLSPRPLTPVQKNIPCTGLGLGRTLERHPFSGLIHSAGES